MWLSIKKGSMAGKWNDVLLINIVYKCVLFSVVGNCVICVIYVLIDI